MFLIFFLHLLHIYIILFIITKLIAGLAMQSFDLYTYHLFFDYFMVLVNYVFGYRIKYYRLFFCVSTIF